MSMLELKKIIINELVNQIDNKDKKDIAKEFGISEDSLDELVKKLLDKWLTNPDLIVMIATSLGLSMPRKTKDRPARYIG